MTQQQGRTRWKRFGLVMVPTLAVTAAVGVALSQAALAASFNVSGQNFKVSADKLVADGFTQFGALDKGQDAAHPVAISGMGNAKISNMCQSVVIPDIPIVGDVTLRLSAGKKTPAVADQLYVDLNQLDGDATFTNLDIGTAIESLDKGPGPKKDDLVKPGSFSQQADHVEIDHVRQVAWATSAGTFKLQGLSMSVKTGKHECF